MVGGPESSEVREAEVVVVCSAERGRRCGDVVLAKGELDLDWDINIIVREREFWGLGWHVGVNHL